MYSRACLLSLRYARNLVFNPMGIPRLHGAISTASLRFPKPSQFSTCLILSEAESSGNLNLELEEADLTLYVGSLGRWATEDSLRDYFSTFGEIQSLSVKCTTVMKTPRYAHVSYKDGNILGTILSQNHALNGHKLQVQRCNRHFRQDGKTCFVQVRNLSPETSLEDITQHFSAYGPVVFVDWPSHPVTKARHEFCFVQFPNNEDAEAAAEKPHQFLGTQDVQVRKSYSRLNRSSTDTILLYPPEDATVESCLEHFREFGKIRSITGRFTFVDASSPPKPYIWIRFEDPSCILDAVKETNVINGQIAPTKRTPSIPTKLSVEKKLFVDKLPVDITKEVVMSYFRKFGDLASCNFMRNPQTGDQLNWCLVTFLSSGSVDEVMSKGNHQIKEKDIRVRRLGWKELPPI